MRPHPDAPGEPRGTYTPFDASDAEARALASGVRLRILRLALDEPLTNREIAEALDLNPATSLHHVRTLVDTGFLEAMEARRGRRGAREIPYQATGKSWYARTRSGTSSLLEAFLAELGQVPEDQQGMSRLGLRLPAEELDEFRDRLHALLTEFHDRPRDTRAEPWSVFVALHPDVALARRSEVTGDPQEGDAGDAVTAAE